MFPDVDQLIRLLGQDETGPFCVLRNTETT